MADSESPSLDQHSSTTPIEWIVQQQRGGLRLGRAQKLDDGSYRVSFEDGAQTHWSDLNGVRVIAEGSVEWRSLADRPSLIQDFRNTPLEVIVTLLREIGTPIDVSNLRYRLKNLGLVNVKGSDIVADAVPWEPLWKKVGQTLRRHPHVRWDASSKTYAWSAEAIEKRPDTQKRKPHAQDGDADAALKQLARKNLLAPDKESAKRRLREANEAGDLSEAQRAAAMAAGALQHDAVSWGNVSVGDIPEGLVPQVFELAARQHAFDWILESAASTRAQLQLDAAGQVLSEASSSTVDEALTSLLKRVTEATRKEATTPAQVRRALRQLREVVARPPQQIAVSAVIDLLKAMPQSETSDWTEATGAAAAWLAAAHPAALSGGLRDRPEHELIGIGQRLSRLPLSGDSGRAAYLRALATDRPEVLTGPNSGVLWKGLDAAQLPELVRPDDTLARVLISRDRGVGRTVTEPRLRSHVARATDDELLAMVSWPSRLQQLIPTSDWLDAVERAVPETNIVRRAIASAREAVAAHASSELEELKALHEAELRSARELTANAEREAQAHRERADQLNEELRQAAVAAHGAHESQLRQAQMSTLTMVADMLDELRRFAAAADSSSAIHAAFSRLSTIAADIGLEELDEVGAVVPFDPKRHKLLADSTATDVVVVEPAWGTRDHGVVTVVRYGKVAPAT